MLRTILLIAFTFVAFCDPSCANLQKQIKRSTADSQDHLKHAHKITAANLLDSYKLPSNATGATAFALIYGVPLLSFDKEFDGAKGLKLFGTNKLQVQKGAATAASKSVVHPNADTLYGLAVLDLSQHDVIVRLPPMEPDRMYLLAFFDPFGSQYATIGSISHSSPGDYLLRPRLGSDTYGVVACDGYKGCLNSPTADGTFLVRVELKNNSTDLAYVEKWVSQIEIRKGSKHASLRSPLSSADFEGLSNDTAGEILQLTARLAEGNPPWDANLASAVSDVLGLAGISDGQYQPPAHANLTEAGELFSTRVNATPSDPGTYVEENHGWSIVAGDQQGTFKHGSDFLTRAYLGITIYLENTQSVALYPMPKSNKFTLSAKESLLLSFSGKPPVRDNGFWSVTAYNAAGFLIANPYNKYTVGDRSNITYADGSLVYPDYLHATFNSSAINKPFQILVQAENQPPPSNWTNNWLPSPADGTEFTLTFRLYDPTESLIDGKYEYPVISRHAAIRSEGS